MDLLKFLITRESRVAGFAHGFCSVLFYFSFLTSCSDTDRPVRRAHREWVCL